MTDLTVTVFTFPDLTTPDATQPTWKSASFQDVLGDAGSGEATYQNDEEVPRGKLLQYAVKGVPAKTIFASAYDRTAVTRDEESGEQTTVSGIEAQLDQLAKARVLPPNGVDRLPVAEDRIGDYTDPFCFDDSLWDAANDLWSVGDAKTVWDAAHPDNPIIFRDLTARVLALPGDTTTDAPLGVRRFRQAFDAPYDGAYWLEFGADDVGQWFIDGVPTSSTDARENWTRENYDVVQLSAGPHVMAWSVTNMPWAVAGGNACGGAWALWTPGLEIASLVAHSDASAVCFGPLEAAPGITAGKFMRCLIYECIGAGFLAPFVGGSITSFTDDNDSNGDRWPLDIVPSTKVSTDLLTCFTKDLAPYVELWADPTDWLLHAVIKGNKGASSGVTLSRADNLTGLSQKGERLTSSGNMMALVRWGGGWTFVGSGDEVVFIDLGALNDRAEVERVAQDQLDEFGRLREQGTVAYEPADDSEIPYVTAAFETGATLVSPDSTETPNTARVQTITCMEDDKLERLQVAVQVGDTVLSPQERVNLQLKKMVF